MEFLGALNGLSEKHVGQRNAPMAFAVLELLCFRAVVFNLFHAAAHIATQFNLTISFRKLPAGYMNSSSVCIVQIA